MQPNGRYAFALKSYELDYRRRLPIAVMYRFMQEAAENHAVDLGWDTETLLSKNLSWFLLRLQLRIERYPEGRQQIEVETWPSAAESRFAFREFRLFSEANPSPFAVGSSCWMLMDIVKQRPVTVAALFDPSLHARSERMVREPLLSARGAIARTFSKDFPVRLSDLDLNNHVNNLHYVEWLVEAVPEGVLRERQIAGLDIEYKKQIQYGDTVRVVASEISPGSFLHAMTSMTTGAEVFKASSVWK
jgi:acyl-ACP thioesterase